MKRAIDPWTVAASGLLLLSALLACKKKDEPAPAASAAVPPAVSIAALPTAASVAPVASAAPVDSAAAAPVLGDVKRFPDKEKAAAGAVKVTVDNSLVYDQPDDKTPSVASLTKDIFVERIATLGNDWLLVDFPSGVGKLSPGWIEAKSVGAQVPAVTHATVAAQTTTATLAASASAKPGTAVAPPASAAAKPASTTAPAATAALAPAASAKPKPKPSMISRPK